MILRVRILAFVAFVVAVIVALLIGTETIEATPFAVYSIPALIAGGLAVETLPVD